MLSEFEDNDKARIKPTSWQAITKNFPYSTFDSEQKSWLVVGLEGQPKEHALLQKTIANIASRIEMKSLETTNSRHKPGGETHRQELDEESSVFESLAKEYGFDTSTNEQNEVEKVSMVRPEQIKLKKPDYGHVILYPRSLRCDNCSYYAVLANLKDLKSLQCPSCKKSQLKQLSIIYFCEQCGDKREVTPAATEPEKDGPVFKCRAHPNKSCTLLLQIGGRKITDWAWVCSDTKDKVDDVRYMCRFCSDFVNRKFVKMKPVPTTQTYIRPMTLTSVYFGDEKNSHLTESDIKWLEIEKPKNKIINLVEKIGLEKIGIIEKVQSITAVYGYATWNENSRIRLFKRRNSDTNQFEYSAYFVESEGKGVLFRFDKYKVTKIILESIIDHYKNDKQDGSYLTELESKLIRLTKKSETEETYTWLLEQTKHTLENNNRDDLLYNTDLFRLLHSIEHSLSFQAALMTGLEESSFSGMVMLESCSILIYEKENVGAGGIDYLKNELLNEWIASSINQIRDCGYDCQEGCVKCLYIRDPLCHPFWPVEINSTYLFPNSLLSREVCLKFLGLR